MKQDHPKQVAIAYHWFAHYRRPIMEALVNDLSGEFEFTFIADTTSLEPAMKVLQPGSETDDEHIDVRWQKVTNRPFGRWIWQSGLISILRKSRFDAVIFLGEFRIISTWFALMLARFRGAKVYFWSHGLYGNESWFKLKIRLLFCRLADGIFLYGHYSRNLLIENGFDPNTLFVVYNSLDHARQMQIRDSQTQQSLSDSGSTEDFASFFPANESAPVLVFVGRLTARKQLPLLLESVKILVEQGDVVNAVIVGDGPERERLEQLAAELQISAHVHFFGSCHDEVQLAGLIQTASLCVSPGDIGLLAMHSLVFGTPVVTHDQWTTHGPEFEAIIDGETGGFFQHGNSKALADEIVNWIALDGDRMIQIKRNCFQVVDTFFNPQFQTKVFATVLNGSVPPDSIVSLDGKNSILA